MPLKQRWSIANHIPVEPSVPWWHAQSQLSLLDDKELSTSRQSSVPSGKQLYQPLQQPQHKKYTCFTEMFHMSIKNDGFCSYRVGNNKQMTLGITDITPAVVQLHVIFTKTKIRYESGQEILNCRLFLKVTMKWISTPNACCWCYCEQFIHSSDFDLKIKMKHDLPMIRQTSL